MGEHGRVRRDARQESEEVVRTHGAGCTRLRATRQHLFDCVRELHLVALRDENIALGDDDVVVLCVHLVADEADGHV